VIPQKPGEVQPRNFDCHNTTTSNVTPYNCGNNPQVSSTQRDYKTRAQTKVFRLSLESFIIGRSVEARPFQAKLVLAVDYIHVHIYRMTK
jgi:hypothetical protein